VVGTCCIKKKEKRFTPTYTSGARHPTQRNNKPQKRANLPLAATCNQTGSTPELTCQIQSTIRAVDEVSLLKTTITLEPKLPAGHQEHRARGSPKLYACLSPPVSATQATMMFLFLMPSILESLCCSLSSLQVSTTCRAQFYIGSSSSPLSFLYYLTSIYVD
jgi:hypothetical protein